VLLRPLSSGLGRKSQAVAAAGEIQLVTGTRRNYLIAVTYKELYIGNGQHC